MDPLQALCAKNDHDSNEEDDTGIFASEIPVKTEIPVAASGSTTKEEVLKEEDIHQQPKRQKFDSMMKRENVHKNRSIKEQLDRDILKNEERRKTAVEMSSDVVLKYQQEKMIEIATKCKQKSKSSQLREKSEKRREAFKKIIKEDKEVDVVTTKKLPKRRTVLDKMVAVNTMNGPLRVLYDCMTNGFRVKVWIRRYKGLRGILTGYVVAFDLHMNLAMIDVSEMYTIESWMIGDPIPKSKRKKKKDTTIFSEREDITDVTVKTSKTQNTLKLNLLPKKVSSTSDYLKKFTQNLRSHNAKIETQSKSERIIKPELESDPINSQSAIANNPIANIPSALWTLLQNIKQPIENSQNIVAGNDVYRSIHSTHSSLVRSKEVDQDVPTSVLLRTSVHQQDIHSLQEDSPPPPPPLPTPPPVLPLTPSSRLDLLFSDKNIIQSQQLPKVLSDLLPVAKTQLSHSSESPNLHLNFCLTECKQDIVRPIANNTVTSYNNHNVENISKQETCTFEQGKTNETSKIANLVKTSLSNKKTLLSQKEDKLPTVSSAGNVLVMEKISTISSPAAPGTEKHFCTSISSYSERNILSESKLNLNINQKSTVVISQNVKPLDHNVDSLSCNSLPLLSPNIESVIHTKNTLSTLNLNRPSSEESLILTSSDKMEMSPKMLTKSPKKLTKSPKKADRDDSRYSPNMKKKLEEKRKQDRKLFLKGHEKKVFDLFDLSNSVADTDDDDDYGFHCNKKQDELDYVLPEYSSITAAMSILNNPTTDEKDERKKHDYCSKEQQKRDAEKCLQDLNDSTMHLSSQQSPRKKSLQDSMMQTIDTLDSTVNSFNETILQQPSSSAKKPLQETVNTLIEQVYVCPVKQIEDQPKQSLALKKETHSAEKCIPEFLKQICKEEKLKTKNSKKLSSKHIERILASVHKDSCLNDKPKVNVASEALQELKLDDQSDTELVSLYENVLTAIDTNAQASLSNKCSTQTETMKDIRQDKIEQLYADVDVIDYNHTKRMTDQKEHETVVPDDDTFNLSTDLSSMENEVMKDDEVPLHNEARYNQSMSTVETFDYLSHTENFQNISNVSIQTTNIDHHPEVNTNKTVNIKTDLISTTETDVLELFSIPEDENVTNKSKNCQFVFHSIAKRLKNVKTMRTLPRIEGKILTSSVKKMTPMFETSSMAGEFSSPDENSREDSVTHIDLPVTLSVEVLGTRSVANNIKREKKKTSKKTSKKKKRKKKEKDGHPSSSMQHKEGSYLPPSMHHDETLSTSNTQKYLPPSERKSFEKAHTINKDLIERYKGGWKKEKSVDQENKSKYDTTHQYRRSKHGKYHNGKERTKSDRSRRHYEERRRSDLKERSSSERRHCRERSHERHRSYSHDKHERPRCRRSTSNDKIKEKFSSESGYTTYKIGEATGTIPIDDAEQTFPDKRLDQMKHLITGSQNQNSSIIESNVVVYGKVKDNDKIFDRTSVKNVHSLMLNIASDCSTNAPAVDNMNYMKDILHQANNIDDNIKNINAVYLNEEPTKLDENDKVVHSIILNTQEDLTTGFIESSVDNSETREDSSTDCVEINTEPMQVANVSQYVMKEQQELNVSRKPNSNVTDNCLSSQIKKEIFPNMPIHEKDDICQVNTKEEHVKLCENKDNLIETNKTESKCKQLSKEEEDQFSKQDENLSIGSREKKGNKIASEDSSKQCQEKETKENGKRNKATKSFGSKYNEQQMRYLRESNDEEEKPRKDDYEKEGNNAQEKENERKSKGKEIQRGIVVGLDGVIAEESFKKTKKQKQIVVEKNEKEIEIKKKTFIVKKKMVIQEMELTQDGELIEDGKLIGDDEELAEKNDELACKGKNNIQENKKARNKESIFVVKEKDNIKMKTEGELSEVAENDKEEGELSDSDEDVKDVQKDKDIERKDRKKSDERRRADRSESRRSRKHESSRDRDRHRDSSRDREKEYTRRRRDNDSLRSKLESKDISKSKHESKDVSKSKHESKDVSKSKCEFMDVSRSKNESKDVLRSKRESEDVSGSKRNLKEEPRSKHESRKQVTLESQNLDINIKPSSKNSSNSSYVKKLLDKARRPHVSSVAPIQDSGRLKKKEELKEKFIEIKKKKVLSRIAATEDNETNIGEEQEEEDYKIPFENESETLKNESESNAEDPKDFSELNIFQQRNKAQAIRVKRTAEGIKKVKREDIYPLRKTERNPSDEIMKPKHSDIRPHRSSSSKGSINEDGFLARRLLHRKEKDEQIQRMKERRQYERDKEILKKLTAVTYYPAAPVKGSIFKKRHMNQLFVRGDNIVMIAYDRSKQNVT